VDLHGGNDDVLKRIAQPLINKEVTLVLDDLAVSAPVINPGITGRDVEITGTISRAEAINVAASIVGIAPSQVRIDTSG
jgi:preprotein translocase subunit SecD